LKVKLPTEKKLPETVSTAELAQLFGVSAKTVSAWAKVGIVVRAEYGRFDLSRSVRAVVKHHKRGAAEATVATAVGSQRERLLRAQADKAVMSLALETGELCRESEVRGEVMRTFYILRSGVMAVKARIGGRLPHLTRTDLEEVDGELREALTALGTCRYDDAEAWTVRPGELAEQLALTVEEVERLAKAGVLPAPDSEGRLSLWGSVRALVAMERPIGRSNTGPSRIAAGKRKELSNEA
jgi:phage terminase Nu1 subunit (DNA packaging protein)